MVLQRICKCVQKSSNKPSSRKKTSNHKFKPSNQPISHTLQSDSDLGCPHFTNCPGCTLENNLNNPATLDRARQFFQDPTLPLYVGKIHQWRHRSRLAIRPNNNGLLDAGLFQQGSHSLVSIPQCKVQHPSLNKCAIAVVECARATGVQPYIEATGLGDIRYIQMTIANSNNSINDSHLIQLVLIWNDISSISPRLAALVDMLTSTYSDCLHSIWVNFNRSRTNTILGSEYLHVWGNKEAWTTIGGINIAFSPGSFLQANPEAMAAAIESIGRYIAPNNGGKGIKIVDLYAGVGTLGISVAEKLLSNNSDDNDNGLEESSWIRFVEIVPWAQQPFELSSARLMSKNSRSGSSIKPHPMKMEYHVSSAGSDPQQWLQDATVVICDPPRKGLDKKLLDVLCADNNMNSSSVSQLERVIYLSCGYDALEKDCRKLVDSKQWMIRHVEAFLFFPGTEHIETLVVFDRVT